MSSDFPIFAQAVRFRLGRMSKEEMFVVETTDIFASYLAAFPEGTNPVHKVRTEHDCACCKQFVRNFGRTVAIIDGRRVSVWSNHASLPSPYREVAERMDAIIQQAPIAGVFRTKEHSYGAAQTIQMIGADAHRWHHFSGEVAVRHRSHKPDEDRGTRNTTAQVLRRGLTELKAAALDETIDLIEQGVIYRGTEFIAGVRAFRDLQRTFASAADPDLVVWSNLDSPAARIRNTAIGTLLQDLSEGVETERAVRSFEAMVAPTNYKRPKAVITPKMVDSALKTLADLGLDGAIERRFARIEDVSVNDVLFVDNAVRGQMRDGLRGLLMEAATTTPNRTPEATPIGIDEFVERVVPGARHMTLYLSNTQLSNFVSITAPQNADSGRLFKWSNGFAWTYDGDVADSIKERVKRAGGNTGAALRVSLAWTNKDDLDIYATCPDGRIYFGNKSGILDVDMNVSAPRRNAVENLSWTRPKNGRYRIEVNNFNRRETTDVGFTIEVECGGVVRQFTRRDSPKERETVPCVEFVMKDGAMTDLRVLSDMQGGSIPMEKWGIKTGSPVRVNTLLTSPNHWEGAGGVGAKHWFFILDGCRNPDNARGIYNEFLRGDLEAHRKVFEVLGAKTKCPPDDKQLSGVGFTAGRGDRVTIAIGSPIGSSRTYEINF